MCRGERIRVEHLPKEFSENLLSVLVTKKSSLHNQSKESEVEIIKEALQRNLGRRSITAKELGIHPVTLWRKMKQFGLI
jgi:transcriptional regulator with PAS, ATPase and Fis domain